MDILSVLNCLHSKYMYDTYNHHCLHIYYYCFLGDGFVLTVFIHGVAIKTNSVEKLM